MKFNIDQRLNVHFNFPIAGDGIVYLPDNLEDFLAAVQPYGRFSIVAPDYHKNLNNYWTLYFENDYD